MKYTKYLKSGSYDNFIQNIAGIPNITIVSNSHPEYETIIGKPNKTDTIIITVNRPSSVVIKNFTIFGKDYVPEDFILSPCMCDCKTTVFEYEEGMTWEDWVNSKYNTSGFYIRYDDYANYVITNYGGLIFQEHVGTSCKSNDLIVECNENNVGPLYHFN